jgi:hypothetical protein
MNTSTRQLAITVAVLGIGASSCRLNGEEVRESASNLTKQISQIDDVWNVGKQFEYFVQANEIKDRIVGSGGRKDLDAVGLKLFEAVLAKHYHFEDIVSIDELYDCSNEDLGILYDLASHLISARKMPIQEQCQLAKLLSIYLGRLRKERIMDYKPLPSTLPEWKSALPLGEVAEATSAELAAARFDAIRRQIQENYISNARQAAISYAENKLTGKIVA